MSGILSSDYKANKDRKLVPKSGDVAVTKLDHVVLKTLELVCRRNLEKSGDADQRTLDAVSRA
jgi:hypothetical protein